VHLASCEGDKYPNEDGKSSNLVQGKHYLSGFFLPFGSNQVHGQSRLTTGPLHGGVSDQDSDIASVQNFVGHTAKYPAPEA